MENSSRSYQQFNQSHLHWITLKNLWVGCRLQYQLAFAITRAMNSDCSVSTLSQPVISTEHTSSLCVNRCKTKGMVLKLQVWSNMAPRLTAGSHVVGIIPNLVPIVPNADRMHCTVYEATTCQACRALSAYLFLIIKPITWHSKAVCNYVGCVGQRQHVHCHGPSWQSHGDTRSFIKSNTHDEWLYIHTSLPRVQYICCYLSMSRLV